jgi:hypothetical protein
VVLNDFCQFYGNSKLVHNTATSGILGPYSRVMKKKYDCCFSVTSYAHIHIVIAGELFDVDAMSKLMFGKHWFTHTNILRSCTSTVFVMVELLNACFSYKNQVNLKIVYQNTTGTSKSI